MNQPKNPSPGMLLCMLTMFRTDHWFFICTFWSVRSLCWHQVPGHPIEAVGTLAAGKEAKELHCFACASKTISRVVSDRVQGSS